MADNLKERIQELRELAEKATPGPWIAYPSFPEWIVPDSDVLKYIGGSIDEVEDRERFTSYPIEGLQP